ncbi:MAG: KH domain-containing protein [Ruminococcaceae bacterium]|nr:KH domain-containing protein [Oscillospiraceae bacterium]
MKELLEYIARALVDYPEDVVVREVEDEQGLVLELHVRDEDMGKVIGKQGRIAKSIRAVMKAAASRENTRVSVEIMQ